MEIFQILYQMKYGIWLVSLSKGWRLHLQIGQVTMILSYLDPLDQWD